ncbi:hypothetical protein EELLY_v1c04360 [Entomoplasma ellychniae]|uniref:N-acetyltransferase domain-containing protein n=1 Tax=Entomoplasma ellychniae TaxID=2114 RepID=A0A8E2UAQ2_9MOLU|nr:hypothetical protein [Entomoplasma ellychniae]PPE04756.1 hypothetical protein EELLY_v1c04360 [Entomoplasma ellychniae]
MKKEYDIIFDYKDNKHFNQDLNGLIRKSNNENFEKWIFKNKNLNNFLPVTIINEKNEIIAALGITKFEIFIGDEKCTAIQLGNLFLKEAHKHENLEVELINAAIDKYSNVVDIIISFSNDIDEHIYEQTKFKKTKEYLYFLNWKHNEDTVRNKIKKLDLDLLQDFEIMTEKIKHSTKQSSHLDSKFDSSIKTFNILKYFSNDTYHIPSLDVVVCYKYNKDVFDLISIFAHDKVDIEYLLKIIVPKHIKRVDFGFIPDLKEGLHIANTDIFVRSSENKIKSTLWTKEITTNISDSKIIFPILSRQK